MCSILCLIQKSIITTILIFYSLLSYSQTKTELWSSENRVNVYYSSGDGKTIGSPFLSDSWMLGYIYAENDTIRAFIRYNILAKRMSFIHKDDTLDITKPFMINRIIFSNLHFIYSIAVQKMGKRQFVNSDYFQVLTGNSDQLQLLSKMSKNLEENSYVGNYMGGGGDGRTKIVLRTGYYLKKADGCANPVKRTRKSLLSVMSDKKEELISFIYNEKLLLKK